MNLGFAQPLWLLGLLPVLMLGAWLLVGQPTPAAVPFLHLWPRRRVGPASRARRRVPPIAIVLIWIAMLLAVIAIASPQWRGGAGVVPVTVIVDGATGVTDARHVANLASLAASFEDPRTEVNLLRADGTVARQSIGTINPTNAVSPADLRAAISSRLRAPDELIVVVSDRALPLDQPRVFRVAADAALSNVSVVRVAGAHGQAMIAVESSSVNEHTLVASVIGDETRSIEIAMSTGRGVGFVELPAATTSVEVRLAGDDDVPADDVATLQRVAQSARPEQQGDLPEPIVRLLQAYQVERGDDPSGTTVLLSTSEVSSAPAIRITPTIGAGGVVLQDHPITRSFDTATLPLGPLAGPVEGWTAVATIAGQPAIAIRTEPARQVWIGLDIERAAISPEAIALLTRAIDWAGSTERVAYRMVDRNLPQLASVDEADRQRLREALANLRPAGAQTPLAPWLSVAIIAVLLAALGMARR